MTVSNVLPAQDEERPSGRWWDLAAAVAIAIAVALRLLAFLDRRPLWTDEALLALNVATRGFFDLLRPLDYVQNAPIPFLWASRGVTELLGVNEYALRLAPLLAGLALPVVLWRLARRVLGPPEGLFAATLAAISLLLVYYATEFKQYAVDALVTAMLVAETVRFLREDSTPRSWARLAAVGALALLCSQPAVFVLTGTGAVLLARTETRARPGRPAAVLLLWTAVFGVLYLASYSPAAGSTVLQRHWEGTFLRPGAADLATRLMDAGERLLVLPLFPPPARVPVAVVALAFLAGVAGVVRRRGWPLGILLVVPFMAVVVASMAGLYAPVQRLLLFLAPLTFLVLSGLISLTRRAIPTRRQAVVQAGLCIAPVALNTWPLAVFLFAPGPTWNARSIIASLPSDATVYVWASSLPEWAFYTTDWQRPEPRWLALMSEVTGNRGRPPANGSNTGPCEGDRRTMRDHDRLEIIGASTGMEYRERIGYTRDLPDPRWAEHESRRIRAAGDSAVWVFSARRYPAASALLRSRLVRNGGYVVEERIQDRWHRASSVGPGDQAMASAYRVMFRGPPASDPCSPARLDGNPPAESSRRDTM